jgi:hypothetical protein
MSKYQSKKTIKFSGNLRINFSSKLTCFKSNTQAFGCMVAGKVIRAKVVRRVSKIKLCGKLGVIYKLNLISRRLTSFIATSIILTRSRDRSLSFYALFGGNPYYPCKI